MNLLIKELQEIEDKNQAQIYEITLQKRKSIKIYDYDEAENCDNLISEIRSQENEIKKQKIYNYFETEIQNIYNRSKNMITSLKLQNRQNEQKIRNSISNTYHRMQKKHKTDIANAEAEYEKQKQIQASRPVAESTFLLNQSQKEAFQGNYNEARRLKLESENAAVVEVKKRLEALEQNYQLNIKKILDTTKIELNELSQKLNELLNESQKQSEKQIQEEESHLENRFIEHLQETAKFIFQKCKQDDQQLIYMELREIMEKTLTNIGIPLPQSLFSLPQNKKQQNSNSNNNSSSYINYNSSNKEE